MCSLQNKKPFIAIVIHNTDIFNIGIKDILVNVFQNSERNSNKNEENQVLTIFA